MCTVPQIAPSPSLPSDPTRPLALLAFIGMDAHWTDDPVFDTAWEDVGGGVIVRGDAWRRLQRLREEHGCAGEVLRVAGPTFRADAVHHAASHGGDDVRVVPEPTNAADTNARKVVVSGSHVGYLPRGCALSSGPVRLLCVGTAPVPHCWLFVGA